MNADGTFCVNILSYQLAIHNYQRSNYTLSSL